MQKENMKKENMKKEDMKKENMKKENMKKEDMKKENMKKENVQKILIALFLTVVMCLMATPVGVHASSDDWEAVEDTFTIENIQHFIPDKGFATAVYNDIKTAIEETTEDNPAYHVDKKNILDPDNYTDKWPEPLTLQEIIDSGETGDDLVEALLRNYAGPISAYRKGITDISGYEYLKNTTSIDFQSNLIEDLSGFTGTVVGGSYNFNSNPIHIWPKTFPDTVRAATHGVPTSFTVTTAPLLYRFGETVEPTLKYNVYYPDKNTLNKAWYSKYRNTSTAYGETVPKYPQVNGTDSITLPPFSLEGKAILEIGLTGKKNIEDYDNWVANTANAINYISGMGTDERGGTPGQGNSPSYNFEVTAQRYATVNLDSNTKVTGGFTFTKTSEATGDTVAGAEYTLYKDEGCKNKIGGPYTTDENGKIQEDGFDSGTYYLKETKAPNGYSINENAVKIVIDNPEVVVSVDGGVAEFEHDDLNPSLEALWGTKTATTGVWDKKTTTTTKTAEDYGADALLTNKGNTGYMALSSVTGKTKDNEAAYNKEDIKIIVKMADEKYGEYTSEADALAAINTIVKTKKLTGDIDIEYSATFKEKKEAYTNVGQTDKLLDSSNPGTSTDPNNPGTTTGTDPDNPGTPTDPDNPGTPTDPDNPGTPTDPDNPGTPTDPDNPGTPTDPDNPGTPTDPDNSGTTIGTGTDNSGTTTGTGTDNPGTNAGTGTDNPGTTAGTGTDNPGTNAGTGTDNSITASETDSDNLDTVGVTKTGDNTLLLPLVILMTIAAMGIVCVVFKKKKHDERE